MKYLIIIAIAALLSCSSGVRTNSTKPTNTYIELFIPGQPNPTHYQEGIDNVVKITNYNNGAELHVEITLKDGDIMLYQGIPYCLITSQSDPHE